MLRPTQLLRSVGQRFSLSWRAYAANMSSFHRVPWDVSDADYLHRDVNSHQSILTCRYKVQQYLGSCACFLTGKEIRSKRRMVLAKSSYHIIHLSSWLRCFFHQGIPFSCPNASAHLSVRDFFFSFGFEKIQQKLSIWDTGRGYRTYFNTFNNSLLIGPLLYQDSCVDLSETHLEAMKTAMYGMLTMLPALEDHPLAFLKRHGQVICFFNNTI